VSFIAIANAIAVAVIAALAVIYWHGKHHHDSRQPPDEPP